jgi:predicted SprT family Zn-dependent metalloprotease
MARRPGISADTKSSRADNRLGCQYLVSLARTWDQRRIARLQIVINPRLKSTLARWVPPEDVLEVSLAAQTRGKRLFREILCHEAAHVVVWHESGPSARPHGPEWAALMRAAGFNARATLSRCAENRLEPFESAISVPFVTSRGLPSGACRTGAVQNAQLLGWMVGFRPSVG